MSTGHPQRKADSDAQLAPTSKWVLRFNVGQAARHLLYALVCGILCGFGSITLCIVVDGARHVFERLPWLIWLLPVIGIAQLLLYRWWKLPLDLTTDAVIERMRGGHEISGLLAPGILIANAMTILAGGTVGKEAGAMQMGASLGTTIARPFRLHNVVRRPNHDDTQDMHLYVAATGMAATFSALFFAPLGSCMLVLELMRFAGLRYVCSMLVACFAGFVVARHFGIGDVITKVGVPQLNWHGVGMCVVIGVAAALFGSLFAIAIRLVQGVTKRIRRNCYLWVVVGGLLVAVLVTACGWTRFTGSGGTLLNDVLRSPNVSFDFLIKMLLTILCLGFWFKGGEIMPSLCIGGMIGSASFAMTGGDALFGAAVGSICFLAAFNRCPLSAFLLGCEIFGWAAAPFLAIGVCVAFMFGYPVGIYGSGIDLLARSGWKQFFHGMRQSALRNEHEKDAGFIDFAVAAGSQIQQVASTAQQAARREGEQWRHEVSTWRGKGRAGRRRRGSDGTASGRGGTHK